MINYYEILGLNSSAGILEIKSSFRHLAKLYHPDKNPDGIEHFAKLLRAYETLSDPALKASYDYRLNYHQSQSQPAAQNKSQGTTKNWKFDERELKRRQYYNDHIKKYAKQTSDYVSQAETKKNYNEFKYVLFATPLAVILFLLIMHLSTRDREQALDTDSKNSLMPTQDPATVVNKIGDLKLGDAPYTAVFGKAKYDTIANKTLKVKNLSGVEIIICLYSKKEFIRSFYLQNNISAEVSQLPKEPLSIYYCSGSNFDYTQQLIAAKVYGAFTKDLAFYKSNQTKRLNSFNELTLLRGPNQGFAQIDEKEFFKHAKK